jgi:hypothetical protein
MAPDVLRASVLVYPFSICHCFQAFALFCKIADCCRRQQDKIRVRILVTSKTLISEYVAYIIHQLSFVVRSKRGLHAFQWSSTCFKMTLVFRRHLETYEDSFFLSLLELLRMKRKIVRCRYTFVDTMSWDVLPSITLNRNAMGGSLTILSALAHCNFTIASSIID